MKTKLIAPILTMIVGITWLLNTYDVIKGVDWVWTGGLAAAGILSLWLGGLNKLTVITGPVLIAGSIFSVLRQTGNITLEREIPMLVIILGFLMLLSHLLNLPSSELFKEGQESTEL